MTAFPFPATGFTRDVLTVITQSEESIAAFRSQVEQFEPEQQPAALLATVAGSLASQFFGDDAEKYPWILRQIVGRALHEHVDWEAVLRELKKEQGQKAPRFSLN